MKSIEQLKKLAGAVLVGLCAVTTASSAFAGTVTLQVCKTSDVQVTGIAQYDSTLAGAKLGDRVDFATPLNAAACVGAYEGNDQTYPTDKTGGNLGYYGDGLMNGGLTGPSAGSAQLFPNGVFSNLYLSSDLNGDNILDPGWIMLGKYQNGGFSLEKVGGLDIVWSSFFKLTIDGDGSYGKWEFTPDAEVAKRAESILGRITSISSCLSSSRGRLGRLTTSRPRSSVWLTRQPMIPSTTSTGRGIRPQRC